MFVPKLIKVFLQINYKLNNMLRKLHVLFIHLKSITKNTLNYQFIKTLKIIE